MPFVGVLSHFPIGFKSGIYPCYFETQNLLFLYSHRAATMLYRFLDCQWMDFSRGPFSVSCLTIWLKRIYLGFIRTSLNSKVVSNSTGWILQPIAGKDEKFMGEGGSHYSLRKWWLLKVLFLNSIMINLEFSIQTPEDERMGRVYGNTPSLSNSIVKSWRPSFSKNVWDLKVGLFWYPYDRNFFLSLIFLKENVGFFFSITCFGQIFSFTVYQLNLISGTPDPFTRHSISPVE